MKDNFTDDPEESVGEFFQQRREEFRAMKRRRRLVQASALSCALGGLTMLTFFDYRVGAGCACVLTALVIVSFQR